MEDYFDRKYFVLVDVQSLSHAAPRAFGEGAKIDYVKLKEYIKTVVGDADDEHYEWVAYVITREGVGGFLKALESAGYFLVKRRARGDSMPSLSNNMTADVIARMYGSTVLERVVLVSSNELVTPVIHHAQQCEVPVSLVFTAQSVQHFRGREGVKTYHIPESVLYDEGDKAHSHGRLVYDPDDPEDFDDEDDFDGVDVDQFSY